MADLKEELEESASSLKDEVDNLRLKIESSAKVVTHQGPTEIE
jgi:hypothetical protein